MEHASVKHSSEFCLELVPSSARSTSTAANPLPVQFIPLLSDSLEQVKQAISRVLPINKKLTALEEAEFEEDSEEGALAREMTNQGSRFEAINRTQILKQTQLWKLFGYIAPVC